MQYTTSLVVQKHYYLYFTARKKVLSLDICVKMSLINNWWADTKYDNNLFLTKTLIYTLVFIVYF